MKRIALILVLGLQAACLTTTTDSSSRQGSDSPWIEPSASLQAQIDDKVQRLPWTSGMERVELIHWFSAVGEPSYATLLMLCLDERPEVAGGALAALGATFDQRLVNPLRGLDWPEDMTLGVRFERARALLRLGDWSDVPKIIDGLSAENLYVRAICAKTLLEATHESFDYDAQAPADEREASVLRWRDWWSTRTRDPFLIAEGLSEPVAE